MSCVLYIDEEESSLKAIQRTFALNQSNFELVTVNEPNLAFKTILNRDVSVVIADIALNDIHSKEFFQELSILDPSIIRISLTADLKLMTSFNDDGQTHITFSKPLNTAHFLEWVQNLLYYREGASVDLLKYFFTEVKLKSYPENILKIMEMLHKKDFQMTSMADAVNQDSNLKVKLLKFVNSASFGIAKQITETKEALEYLGVNNINNVIRCLNVFSIFEKHNKETETEKALGFLKTKKVIDFSCFMDAKFVECIKAYLINSELNEDECSLNTTVAHILYVMMIDETICEAAKFLSNPSECKNKNTLLETLVLCQFLLGAEHDESYLFDAFDRDLLNKLKKEFANEYTNR